MNGQICLFSATFIKIRRTPAGKKTILLRNIIHERKIITDHCWILFTGEFKRLAPREGVQISFTAEVTRYRIGDRIDYQLRRAHDFKIIE